MGTIADKLSKLTATKNAIKAALAGKGVTVSDQDTFASYADKIGEISDINPNWTDWRYFSYSNNRNDLVSKLKYTDTAQGTDFLGMFISCSQLTQIPELKTTQGINFSSMFDGCSALTTIPKLDTSNGINFNQMFMNCTKLTDIPALDTSKGTSFSFMFHNCRALTTIPVLNLSNCVKYSSVFFNCTALKNLTLTGLVKESGVDLRYSTELTKASITSVINALDASVSGKSVTLSLTAVNAAFETAAGAKDGSASAEWQNLIAAKPNWTISLS